MIVVSGVLEVEAVDRAAAIAAAVRMATETRKEADCQSYAFYGDFEDANRIRVFEEWENGEALVLHFKTPHMAEFSTELAKAWLVTDRWRGRATRPRQGAARRWGRSASSETVCSATR